MDRKSAIEPVHLIYREEGKSEWQVNPRGAAMLEQIRGDLAVIAIIGQYRSGKSYILNRLAGQSTGFALGHTVKGCTRGIWCWGQPIRMGNLNVVLLDVEGLSDPMRDDSHSSKDDDVLFTLSVLLSSLFILNTTGTIDAKKFESLQVATNLSERIRVHNSGEEPNSMQIAEQMPFLLWLVRDFTLELTSDMKTDDDYLESCLKETPLKPGKKQPAPDVVKQCIKLYFPKRGCVTCPVPTSPEQMGKLDTLRLEELYPQFQAKMAALQARIARELQPKRLGTGKGAMVPVDGNGLVAMIRNYVAAINKGALPDVESAWQLIQKAHCQDAVNKAKAAFTQALEQGRQKLVGNSGRALDIDQVELVTGAAFKVSFECFKKNALGDQQSSAEFLNQLRNELATYKDGPDGIKVVSGGILKEFTDKNYQIALSSGQQLIKNAVESLRSAKFENFEAFKVERVRRAQDLDSKLQKSVAYAELSEHFMKMLNTLSTQLGLEFQISATEKEKERLLADAAKKEIEAEKKTAELQQALMNATQVKSTVSEEKDYLREKSEREYMEMKERWAREAKAREAQIQADVKNGFAQRAEALRKELAEERTAMLRTMMQMQKDANDQQNALTQKLMEMKVSTPPPQPQQRRPAGLLTSLLAPVAGLVDGLLPLGGGQGGGLVSGLLNPLTQTVDNILPLGGEGGGLLGLGGGQGGLLGLGGGQGGLLGLGGQGGLLGQQGLVGGVLNPVTQTVGNTLKGGVGGVLNPVTNTVDNLLPLGGAVGGLTRPLTGTVDSTLKGTLGTVGGLTKPVTGTFDRTLGTNLGRTLGDSYDS